MYDPFLTAAAISASASATALFKVSWSAFMAASVPGEPRSSQASAFRRFP